MDELQVVRLEGGGGGGCPLEEGDVFYEGALEGEDADREGVWWCIVVGGGACAWRR